MNGINYDLIIERIRNETNDVKNCFTKFSFQTIAFSGVILAIISAYQSHQPLTGLSGIFVIVLICIVCKIGNYKYATANRHYGFELYLDDKVFTSEDNIHKRINISWEQAVRAWRIIQSAIFDQVYYTRINTKFYQIIKRYNYNRVKLKSTEMPTKGWWFEPPKNNKNELIRWYPGRYLKSMQSALLFFAYLSFIPLTIMVLQFQIGDYYTQYPFPSLNLLGMKFMTVLTLIVSIVTAFIFLFKVRQIHARRKLLEEGLLSIPACAIMWEVVVLAHYKARIEVKFNEIDFIVRLSDEADNIIENINDIYKWINKIYESDKNTV